MSKKSAKNITELTKSIINEIEFENLVLLENEEFKDLVTPLYPEIKKGYKISNKNRIYSTESKKLLSVKIKKHGNGYHSVSLQTTYENCPYTISKVYSMHRLIMSVFCPTDNMDKLMINHKDGNKANNDLSNLEWCTPSENSKHALIRGLYVPKKGEECSFSIVNEKIVRGICKKWLSGKYTKKEIADIYGINPSTVWDITNGNSWCHITKDYDFSKRPTYRKSKYFTPDEIHMFCRYFSDNKIQQEESIRQYLIRSVLETGYLNNESDITENLLYVLRGIYLKKYYKKINSLYIY